MISDLKHYALALTAALSLMMSTGAAAAAPISELVVDGASGRTLFAAYADRVRPPASLTKLMTLLLTFEAIAAGTLRLDYTVIMSRRGARQPPSRLGLAAGQPISVRSAMKVVAVVSANDVAVALAERVAGSEAAFVRAMNRRAARLGMTDTRFGNATGLSPAGGVTTARDIATLARHIIRQHPTRYALFAARTIRWGGAVRPSHNRLLGKVRGVDGLKTGYTVAAGYNLAASALRGDRRVIVVVLGAGTAAARDLRVSNLLESGFSAPAKRRVRGSPRG